MTSKPEMQGTGRTDAERVAESYYDSSDADAFYETVWGGEDIHIGLYEPGLSIQAASRRTVVAMAELLQTLGPDSRVLDLGAGYGGSARYLAREFGCHVTCLNLSEVQNERNRQLNRQQQLEHRVSVLHGSFESIPCEADSFDIVWSQDAFLHSDRRTQIISEIDRVMTHRGELVFTDPMQADDCPEGVLKPVYDRLDLQSLASIAFYRSQLAAHGFQEQKILNLVFQLRNHYDNVRAKLEADRAELSQNISAAYIDRMIAGLKHWVAAADAGYLAWGILYFTRNIDAS
ncbi:MAG: methyltransferase domain-containing protein [Pseudomonadales bacterium]|nr:methyltransferase domain-containing protein [Pseudomonadales bacterium]